MEQYRSERDNTETHSYQRIRGLGNIRANCPI